MPRPTNPDAGRCNVQMDQKVRKALERHRRKLARERGVDVSRSDAVRDAILRTEVS